MRTSEGRYNNEASISTFDWAHIKLPYREKYITIVVFQLRESDSYMV